MVISQTPLRVSFFGGGTDFKAYYENYGGTVLSAAINKYIYVIVTPRDDDDIVLNYSKRERVNNVNDIEHKIIREALKITNITRAIEITSFSDIHSDGSGLGSSSAFTVGLLNSLFAYKGEYKNPAELAEFACKIEIDILGEPIGKQDQYASAFGGLKKYSFNKDGTVTAKEIEATPEAFNTLNICTSLFYTGITRKASSVLHDQKTKIGINIENLNRLKEITLQGEEYIRNADIENIGRLLNENWENKKRLSNKINNDKIDAIYSKGRQAGAYGGKLLGAGGGGYFLFAYPLENYKNIKSALEDFKEMPFTFEFAGSRIVFNNGKNTVV
ncbi:GHMP kinase [Ruminiclostridium herbifermentans]|uniref:GHMP kinase n=1 Tax=Ruminiclostridium herbifermentans TaxID=2488810 RepID=A0A4U7JLM8_9FIRM|nr:GHMP kinase [Ruminiclostridium herbifermentans]QNU68228.1 GHMP kinase [Ruminiclostridium herbifermentans]